MRRSAKQFRVKKGDDEKARGIDWLGLDYQDLTAPLRQNLGIPARAQGVVVRDIEASSPLVDEGVSPGDIVTEVNGHAVASGEELEKEVAKAASGSYLRFYLRRFDPHSGGEDEEGVGFFAIVRVP